MWTCRSSCYKLSTDVQTVIGVWLTIGHVLQVAQDLLEHRRRGRMHDALWRRAVDLFPPTGIECQFLVDDNPELLPHGNPLTD